MKPNGSKLWKLKYRFLEKEKKLSFGSYAALTLAKARERQAEARRLLAEGTDPAEHKKKAKRVAIVAAANTFEAVAREWFEKFSKNWAESHLDCGIQPLQFQRSDDAEEPGSISVRLSAVCRKRSHALDEHP